MIDAYAQYGLLDGFGNVCITMVLDYDVHV